MQKIESLFDEALTVPPQDREAFLLQACDDNETLLKELRSLLSADAESNGFFGDDIGTRVPLTQLFPKAGELIEHYVICRLIGGSNIGRVYLANDTVSKSLVAMKFLPAAMSGSAGARLRFRSEAQAASRLNHPCIGSIRVCGETAGNDFYVVMPFYDGVCVATHIKNGSLSTAVAINITVSVCDGLAAVHAAGIIHRDIKPANIIYMEGDKVKILDFGMAEFAGIDLTHAGGNPYSLAYMSPEQLKGETADVRTDVWALGATLYEMLTGECAFPDRDIHNTSPAVAHTAQQPDLNALGRLTLDDQNKHAELIQIIQRALAHDRKERFATIGNMQAALRNIQNG
jgi:serine/threonine protein kinase